MLPQPGFFFLLQLVVFSLSQLLVVVPYNRKQQKASCLRTLNRNVLPFFVLYELGGFVSVCYDLHRLFEMLQIHLRNKQCILLHVLSMLLFDCFWMFKRWFNFRFAITVFELCECVKMTILFCIYFRQYTNMCMGANGDVCL